MDPSPTQHEIFEQAQQALSEDLGTGDLTPALIGEVDRASATLVGRAAATVCGRDWVEAVFHQLDPSTKA